MGQISHGLTREQGSKYDEKCGPQATIFLDAQPEPGHFSCGA
jgi:hypothetical protein